MPGAVILIFSICGCGLGPLSGKTLSGSFINQGRRR